MSRGFFFTVDAIIAALVLTAGVALFFTAQPAQPDPTAAFSFARGELNVMTNIELADSPEFFDYIDGNPSVPDVNFSDNSVIEQIAEFVFLDARQADASAMAGKVLDARPLNLGACFRLYELTASAPAFSYPSSCQGIKPNSLVGVAQARLVYVKTSGPPFSAGPFIARLEAWQ